MNDATSRRELAYWLALAFQVKAKRKMRNGLVLHAARHEGLGLVELARLETAELPERLHPYAELHRKLRDAEGRVSAQAFVVEELLEARIDVLPLTDADYPRHLVERLEPGRAPTVLFLRGPRHLLEQPGVAVSGSRKAGREGVAFARAMGEALARAGVTLVSGLAAGIDRAALEGALEAGGRAVGVAPEGLLNSKAARQPEIAEGRLAVVNEFDPTQKWAPWTAMQRNQTIAGLSRALVIADCVGQGGTTEQFEIHRKQGLPVFVRRGAGEGKMVDKLARRPGAIEIHWDEGPVYCPDLLSAPKIQCDVETTPESTVLRVEARPDTPVDQILSAVRGIWPERVREKPTEEPDDPFLAALANEVEGLTVGELAERAACSESKARRRLKSLEEASLVTVDRKARPYRYRLVKQDPKQNSGQLAFFAQATK